MEFFSMIPGTIVKAAMRALRRIYTLVRNRIASRLSLVLENLALRQQLAVYRRNEKRPRHGRRNKSSKPSR
jgi:hypothetical protein